MHILLHMKINTFLWPKHSIIHASEVYLYINLLSNKKLICQHEDHSETCKRGNIHIWSQESQTTLQLTFSRSQTQRKLQKGTKLSPSVSISRRRVLLRPDGEFMLNEVIWRKRAELMVPSDVMFCSVWWLLEAYSVFWQTSNCINSTQRSWITKTSGFHLSDCSLRTERFQTITNIPEKYTK